MAEDNTTLDEVVVVGYGTQKKANLTGAVEQVTSEVFEGRPVANTTQMLQGAVPNLNLQMTDGKPMRTASYNVRGTTSVGQGGSALVLIDGVEGDPSLLNPDDIESVSVLKDAASSSIYGSRAPYGVVLITTKAAKTGKTTVNYSATFSIQTPTADYDYVSDGYTWAEHFYKAYYNYNHSNPSGINKTQQFSTAWLAEYKARKESGNLGTVVSNGEWGTTKGRWVYFHEGTDMYGELFKDNTFAQTHNISVSGSEGKFDYYLSGRYYNFAGIFNDDTQTDKYNAYNTRLKVGYQIYDWMKITNNFELSNNKYRNPTTYNESHNVYRNIADEGHPSSPLLNPDGTVTYSGVYSVADFLYGNNWDEYTNDQFKNTTAINTKFFDNKLRVNADFTYQDKRYKNTARKIRTPYSKIAGVIETLSGTQSYMSETRNYTKYMAFNSTAEYENTWGKHYFKGLIGYNYEQSQYDRLYATRNQMVTETVENINLTTDAVNLGIEGSWTKWRSAGAFFRVNYSFDDRYLIEVNGRYDGSSKFLPGNQWAFFPSVSAGWRLTEEPWFNVDPEWISNIKVRASWGELGNSAISAYSFDEKFSLSDGRWFNGVEAKVTSAPTPIPDNLTWETSQTFDVGIDLSLFRDRLNITADWYNRKTLDMYIVGTTLPDVFGASVPKGNFGEMTTTGFELSVGWRDRFQMGGKPFNYSIKATLADYVSTIDKYNNATKSIGTNNTPSYYEGMTIGELWGFTVNGLWQTNDEIDAAEAKAKAAGQKYYNPLTQTDKSYKLYPGDAKYEDLNGNGYIDRGAGTVDDPGDRRIIGNKDPRYIYNFNLSADWNGIFVSAFFQGVGKQDWMPSNEASNFWGQYNRPYNQMPTWHIGNYWTEDNPDAYLPRYTGYYGVLYKGTANANTRYMQDVSYIRLKNLQVGYNLPTKWVSKIGMKKAAIYFSGENLWTWSPMYKWSRAIDVTANIYGTDSERSSTGDGYNYPTMKSYSFGLNITF